MLINTFKIAIKAILTNKSRSFLTMLGVIIGVSSVVILTAIGTGLQSYIEDQFNELGANTIIIYPGNPFNEGGGFSKESQVSAVANSKLEMSDVRDLYKLKEFITTVIPLNMYTDEVSYRGVDKTTTIMGTTHSYPLVQANATTQKGRFFNKTENDAKKKVVVLGHSITEELFGQIDPIGKKIKLGNQRYKVVGVQDEAGSSFGGPNMDTYVFLPIETMFKQYDSKKIVEIVVKTKSSDNIDKTITVIENQLLKKYSDDEFSVFDQSEILDTINQILGVLTIGLGGISSISLIVGGIGIMNIMLVSVSERTKEIGLRKALGATPNNILTQFLIEASVLSILGGTIGLVIAYLGTLVISNYFPAKVTLDAVILAFGVSTAVGLIFGVAPAKKAAQLSPIEALRYE